MSEEKDKLDIPHADVLEANVKEKSSGISAVWVIPIIAAIIGAWLVLKSATEEKLLIEVTFKSAAGLEAGKTAVKFRNIKIGEVKEVKFKDLTDVIVVMELIGVPEEKITDKARFWVVKPRVGADGISGLDTIVSGSYIEIDPAVDGKPAKSFTGLEEPQLYQIGNPGTKYVLESKDLGSLSRGAPVKFRGIQVGSVSRYSLVEDHSHVEIEIFIEAPHDQYVKPETRFWNISGLDVKLDAEGFDLGLDSMATLVSGGIAFSTADEWINTDQANEKTKFELHDTERQEVEEIITFAAPMKMYFKDGVRGLSEGAPVEFKGLRLGTVTGVGVEMSDSHDDILTYAEIEIEPERLPGEESLHKRTEQERLDMTYSFFEKMVKKGLRAQLNTGNVLTGQSLVVLDIFPGETKQALKKVGGVPIIPTVPETLAGLLEQVSSIMAKLEAMPMDEIGQNMKETTASINSLIKSLNAAEGGMMGVQAQEALDELSKAAKAIRAMAEYLERHPEALIKGKVPE